MIKYFEFETKIEKIETILNQLNNNKELEKKMTYIKKFIQI
jgi:hypothetical protein